MSYLDNINNIVNHDINQLNLDKFILKEFQITKLNEVIHKTGNDILEIAILDGNQEDKNGFTIIIYYETENKKFNSFCISFFSLFENKPLNPSFKVDMDVYTPIHLNKNDILIFRKMDLHKKLKLESINVFKFIKNFNKYITLNHNIIKQYYEKYLFEWNNFNNLERVYIYSKLTKKKLKSYLSDFNSGKISVNYPFRLEDLWYGYSSSIELTMHRDYEMIIMRFFPVCLEKNDKIFTNEEMTEWRIPFLDYLEKIKHTLPEISSIGWMKKYFTSDNNENCNKSINCYVNMDESTKKNPLTVFKKVKTILNNILVD
jgi:hypothetical protein